MGGDAWRLLLDPARSAAWNMSVDEALLLRLVSTPRHLRRSLEVADLVPAGEDIGSTLACPGG